MKRQAKTTLAFTTLLFSFITTRSQAVGDTFLVQMNKYKFMPGDTLSIEAAYKKAGKLPPTGTFQLLFEHESGKRITMRWPMINGYVDGDIALPDSLPKGKYTVTMAIQPKFFRVYGQVKEHKKLTQLKTMLLTGKGEWLMDTVAVDQDGSFVIKGWLFEKDATLVFNRTKGNADLDIDIDTWLDSTYVPAAMATREFYLGTPPSTISIDSTGIHKPDLDKFSEAVNPLPEVIVRGKLKTRAEKFNDEYSTGLFRNMNERVFDFMDDPSASSFPNVLDYLQGRVAGLTINRNGGETRAVWRNENVRVYIDEFDVLPDQLNSLSTADIAIVKVFPPGFGGPAIAIYTRRGGGGYFDQTGNKHIFKIKGYSPLETVLDFNAR